MTTQNKAADATPATVHQELLKQIMLEARSVDGRSQDVRPLVLRDLAQAFVTICPNGPYHNPEPPKAPISGAIDALNQEARLVMMMTIPDKEASHVQRRLTDVIDTLEPNATRAAVVGKLLEVVRNLLNV